MNWIKVNEFVEEWARIKQIPSDLRGKTLSLVDFENEGDCHFFYPDRTLHAQEVFTSALARFARARHGRTERRVVTPDHYRAWLLGEKTLDSTETRVRFIESRYEVLPAVD